MNKKILSTFLVEAKLNTYATKGEAKEKINLNSGKELTFVENNLEYKDIYFGYNPFIGEEIVWKDNEIIWGMNYYGQVISKKVTPAKIYEFLKEALKTVKINAPLRGSSKYKKQNFTYINKIKGEVMSFKGEEKIFYKNMLIYVLTYHGGFIKKK